MKKNPLSIPVSNSDYFIPQDAQGDHMEQEQKFIEALEGYLRRNAVNESSYTLPRWALWT